MTIQKKTAKVNQTINTFPDETCKSIEGPAYIPSQPQEQCSYICTYLVFIPCVLFTQVGLFISDGIIVEWTLHAYNQAVTLLSSILHHKQTYHGDDTWLIRSLSDFY